jgi:hypothetical protein
MRNKLIHRLKDAGAISKDTAVTSEQAQFEPQELYWLNYFAGAFLGKIKKTGDHQYYINSKC